MVSTRQQQTAGCACGLLLLVILMGCSPKPPQGLGVISPDLAQQAAATDPATGAVDVATAAGMAPIVVATLRSQSAISGAADRVKSRLATVAEQQAQFLPQISAGVVSNLSSGGGSSPQLGVTATQMLYDFGRTGRGVSRQVLLAQRAHLDFLDVVDENLSEMLRLLANYNSQSRQLDLGRDRLARMSELMGLVENRSLAGATTDNSMIEAQRRVQTAETLLIRAELALASSRREIESESGMTVGAAGPGVSLNGFSCGAAPLQPDLVTAVKIASVDLAVATLDVQTVQGDRLPTLSLEAAYNQDVSGQSPPGAAEVNLQVNMPVFRGGAARSRSDSAVRNSAAAKAALDSARQEAGRAYEHALDTVQSGQVLAKAIGAEVELLDRTRELYLQQFLELGTKTIDDVLDAEEEYHQTLLDLEVSRLDMAVGQIDCLVAEGRLRQVLGIETALLHGLALHQ